MRHDVRANERVRLTVPPQTEEITIEIRVLKVRGATASLMVESRNWLVGSELVRAKRDRGRPKPRKFLDEGRRPALD